MHTTKEKSFREKAEREQKAINWLSDNQGFTQTPTTNQYECFDNYIISGDTNFLGETKVRDNYTAKEIKGFGGAYAEFTKIEGIRQFKENNKLNDFVLYLCFWKDCVEVYKLHTATNLYKWEVKWLPKNNYDTEMVWKHVTQLNEEQLIQTIYYK